MARTPIGNLFPGETWGPRPRWALLPLLAAVAALTTVDRPERSGEAAERPVSVTALKPVAGDDAPEATLPAGGMPIEVAYGVPSARTIRLWTRP